MKLRSDTQRSNKFKTIQDFNDEFGMNFGSNTNDNNSIILNILNGHELNPCNPKYFYYVANYYELVEKNCQESKKWYQKGIDFKQPGCMNNLGVYYETYEKNISEAIKCYEMAILENKNRYAMYNLGLYFEENKNNLNAIKYYKMAAEQGDKDAFANIARIFQKKGDYPEAIRHYKLAGTEITFPVKNLGNWYIYKSIGEVGKFEDKTEPKEVLVFKQKNKWLLKTQDCPVCYQKNQQCIPFECCHYVCNSCYVIIMSEIHGQQKMCPLCRIKLS